MIMESIEKQFKKAKRIGMTPDERSVARYALAKFIDEHPYPGKKIVLPQETAVRISPYMRRSPYMQFFKVCALVLICVLAGGGTLTYASESALPGDTLYPIKNIHEQIIVTLKSNPEEKADYQAKRIEKRITEITTLAANGDLTTEKAKVAQEAFLAQSSDLNKTLDELQTKGRSDVVLATTAKLIPTLKKLEHRKTKAALMSTGITQESIAIEGDSSVATTDTEDALSSSAPELVDQISLERSKLETQALESSSDTEIQSEIDAIEDGMSQEEGIIDTTISGDAGIDEAATAESTTQDSTGEKESTTK